MNRLPKIKSKSQKRLGRGYGSGKGGHTSSRGMKGQKSRRKVGILFEGVKMKKSFIKRLPLRRGKGKHKSKQKPVIVKLDYLNLFATGTKVDLAALVKQGIVAEKEAVFGVKILGGGELKKKLTITVPTSKSVAKAIIKIGGKIENTIEDEKKGGINKVTKSKKE